METARARYRVLAALPGPPGGLHPTGDVYLILDALPLHWTLETMLWNWGHARFHFVPLPRDAAWLNLIEGFWKILMSARCRPCLPHHSRRGCRVAGGCDRLERASPPASGVGPRKQSGGSSAHTFTGFEERRT